jgi:hypothetical protein
VSDERPPFATQDFMNAYDAMTEAGRRFLALHPALDEIWVSCHHQDGKTVFGFSIRKAERQRELDDPTKWEPKP